MRAIVTLLFLCSLSGFAQNTLSMAENDVSPSADLSQVAWMEGHWKGTAFGGIVEEIWSPPLWGSMMFSFKLVNDGAVSFYELGHIREVEETLVFELKHFHGDLKGWEEKDEVQRFALVKVEEGRLFFDGFTFERISDDEVNVYALIHQNDGTEKEVQFNYKRHQI